MSEYDLRLLRMADEEDAGPDWLTWALLAGAIAVTLVMFVGIRLAN